MKKMVKIIFLLFAILTVYGQDDNVLPSNMNYYYADGQKCYWQDDSTSINLIIANMENYEEIVRKLREFFTNEEDEIIYDDEDDNIIVNSPRLPTVPLNTLVERISVSLEDVEFVTYSKTIGDNYIWLRNELYVQLVDTSYFRKLLLLMEGYAVQSFSY